MTSSDGNIFRVTGLLCREFTGEFPTQRQVTWSFDVFFDVCLNERLSKQPCGWRFETPSHSLWRHSNETERTEMIVSNYLVYCPISITWVKSHLGWDLLPQNLDFFQGHSFFSQKWILCSMHSILDLNVRSTKTYLNIYIHTCRFE